MKIIPQRTITLYPPTKYIISQEKAGCKVLHSQVTKKQIWWTIYNNAKRDTLIIYDDPESSTFIRNVVHKALAQGITVYYRSRANCNTNLNPVYEEIIKEKLIKTKDKTTFSVYTLNPIPQEEDITFSEQEKAKLRRYIRYYELELPQNPTTAEWYNIGIQIKYYINNKIPYAYDRNLYYICEECGELIRRGTEDEHICYCDIAPQKTHLDYLINGDE